MRTPSTPALRSGLRGRPLFCTHPQCLEHQRTHPGYRCQRWGYFIGQGGRRIQRFRCRSCRRTFSTQTFSVTYWLKRPQFVLPVASGLVAGSAHRQLARSLHCAPSTVSRLAARLGRHAMLFQADALRRLAGELREPVDLDHFETFELTQDYPFGVAMAVGSGSWFIYWLDPALHRRSGKTSPFRIQRLRARPPRRLKDGYARSTHRTLDALLELSGPDQPLQLITDGHKAYQRTIRRHPRHDRIDHRCFPNPPRGRKGAPRSPEARLRDANMFPVDLLSMILRHTLAHHRRETIAFGRRLNAIMERLALTGVWRNFVKGRSERRGNSETPAMRLELAHRRLRWTEVFRQRRFFHRERVGAPWGELYRREWTTPALPANRTHALRYAF